MVPDIYGTNVAAMGNRRIDLVVHCVFDQKEPQEKTVIVTSIPLSHRNNIRWLSVAETTLQTKLKTAVMKIEKPCAENFSGMTKNNSGRHCSSCNKTVVDFTKMSTTEIQNHLNSSTEEVCGRFKCLQLEQRNGLEKLIFNLRERVSGFDIRPVRVAFLTLLSGVTAFTSSCMGAVQRDYEPNENAKGQKNDSLKVKQESSKEN